MALIDEFKARFPEFAIATVNTYIPILESVWPEYYNRPYVDNKESVLNLVAHLLVGETSSAKSASQVVASKTVDSVSTSYSAISHAGGAMFDFFNTTKYGQRFWMLNKNKFGGYAV